MKFDFDAYEKVFPAEQPPQTPTKGKIKVESAVEVEEPKKQPVENAQPTGSPTNADNGINGLEGGTTSEMGKIEP